MGIIESVALATLAKSGQMPLVEAITRHLTGNCRPSVSESWIPICVDIVQRVWEGNLDLSYELDISGKKKTAEQVVEQFYLDPFVTEANSLCNSNELKTVILVAAINWATKCVCDCVCNNPDCVKCRLLDAVRNYLAIYTITGGETDGIHN